MARELHDVVAHGVSVMLIQAGAARQVMAHRRTRRRGAAAVEATGREAMAELRRLLGVLDEDGEGGGRCATAGHRPARRAASTRVREAGLPAELEIDGDAAAAAASLDVTVYRIVQEALTNALRYARRAAHARPPDAGSRPAPGRGPRRRAGARDAAAATASGRGLVGMRERASRGRAGGSRPGRGSAAGTRSGPGCPGCRTARERRSATRRPCGRRQPDTAAAVLIADDQALVRAGFRMILEAQPDIRVVAEAGDGEAAIRLARRFAPDVVLMDVRMPASTVSRRPAGSSPVSRRRPRRG